MLKSIVAVVIGWSVLPQAFAQTVNCQALRSTASVTLNAACATSEELSLEQTSDFNELSVVLEDQCGEKEVSSLLARGVLYKNLDLSENCNSQALELAQIIK